MENAFQVAQNELAAEALRKKIDRIKVMIGEHENAKKELADAQKRYDGIDAALDKFRRESPQV